MSTSPHKSNDDGAPATKKIRSESVKCDASQTVSSAPVSTEVIDLTCSNMNIVIINPRGEAGALAVKETISKFLRNASASSFKNVVVLASKVEESHSLINDLRQQQGAGCLNNSSTIATLRQLSSNLVDDSFFVVNSETDKIVSTVNAVPIVVIALDAKEEEEEEKGAAVLNTLSGIGAMSHYLRRHLDPNYTKTAEEAKEDAEDPTEPPTLNMANLPLAVMYSAPLTITTGGNGDRSPDSSNANGITRVVQKIKVGSAAVLHSMVLFKPCHTLEHLAREMMAQHKMLSAAPAASITDPTARFLTVDRSDKAPTATTNSPSSLLPTSYSVVYVGASWCPPCMRIIKDLPAMLTGLERKATLAAGGGVGAGDITAFAPSLGLDDSAAAATDIPLATVHAVLKADYDTSAPLLELFNIKTIPTFVVINNNTLVKAVAEGRGVDGGEDVGAAVWANALKKAMVGEPMQNSQRHTVATFLQKTCAAPLTFDDDDF